MTKMEEQTEVKTEKKGYNRLVSDIMIYGASSIIGRFINYLLVPLYVTVMPAQSGSYGVVTNMYAIIALLLVILTYGMETGFFYFANKNREQSQKIFSTILIALGVSSLLFVALTLANIHTIAGWLGYEAHPEHLEMMFIVVAIDAFLSILLPTYAFKADPLSLQLYAFSLYLPISYLIFSS